MNSVTFPMKPQTKGPDVADRQEALRQLLERSAVLRDDERARRELPVALRRDHETQTFGDATRKLIVRARAPQSCSWVGICRRKRAKPCGRTALRSVRVQVPSRNSKQGQEQMGRRERITRTNRGTTP